METDFKNQYLQQPPSDEMFVADGRGVRGPFSKDISDDGFVYLGSVSTAQRVAELCNDIWKHGR